ncbi:MAG: HIT family protein [Candidatus Zixiibacteriota bacterium]
MADFCENCVLCQKILSRELESHPRKVADLQVSTAILSSNQICRGYCELIYNRGHVTELFRLSTEERRLFCEDLNRLAEAIYDGLQPHKLNYELLGNSVPHLHWHLIPRYLDDNLDPHWPIWDKKYKPVKITEEAAGEIIRKIRVKL